MRLDPNDPRLVTGTVQEQQQARDEYRRQQRIAVARRSGMEEVSHDDLEFGRRYISHLPTGRLFHITRATTTGPSRSRTRSLPETNAGSKAHARAAAPRPRSPSTQSSASASDSRTAAAVPLLNCSTRATHEHAAIPVSMPDSRCLFLGTRLAGTPAVKNPSPDAARRCLTVAAGSYGQAAVSEVRSCCTGSCLRSPGRSPALATSPT